MTPAKMAMLVLKDRKGSESMGDDVDDEAMEAPPLEDVLSEMKDALDAGDMKAAAKSFRAAMSLCSDADSYSDLDSDE